MRRITLAILAITVAAWLLGLACSEDRKVIGPQGMAAVRGQVYIWNCGVQDPYNNPSQGDFRFTAQTGNTATVKLVPADSEETVSEVVDLDGFAAVVDTGTYDIIVETGYTYPDTFRTVHLAKDTVLELNIVYGWRTADSMVALFAERLPDTAGEAAERRILDSASVLTGPGMLKPAQAVRRIHPSYDSTWLYVSYNVPIGDGVTAWQVAERTADLYESYIESFGWGFSLAPDVHPCLLGTSSGANAATK